MLYFENDYSEGAHPKILEALTKTNYESLSGYGSDEYCEKAKEKMSAWLSVNGYSGELLYNLLKAGGIFLYGDGSLIDIRDEEVLKNSNFKDLLFPEAYGSKYAKRHIFFENDSATYMRFCYITKAILLYIGFIVVYLMFLIPLILLFMN